MVRAIALIVLATLASPLSAQNIPVYIQKPIAPRYSSLPPATIADLGVNEVEDYGPFVIAQLPESASGTFAAHAARSGLAGRLAPEFKEVRFRDFRIPEKEDAAMDVPAHLRIADYSGQVGLYVVQLKARPRPAWLAELERLGARIIHYLPENSYLIALPPTAQRRLATLQAYRHHVVYQPAYKLERSLRAAADASVARRVLIQLDSEQRWTQLLEEIRSNSVTPVVHDEIGSYVNVSATLPLDRVQALAADSRVIWIERPSVIGLSDERGSQILGGHFIDLSATHPGEYLNYLTSLNISDTSEYIVNVIDTGLDQGEAGTVHPDLAGRIHSWVEEEYTLDPDLRETSDSSGHGTMVAGLIAGNPQQPGGTGLREPCPSCDFYYGTGVAPTARLRITDIFNRFLQTTWEDLPVSAGNLKKATKPAWEAGARFQNLSNNYYGVTPEDPASYVYDTYAQAVDLLVRDSYSLFKLGSVSNPMFMSISAGNFEDARFPGTCPACVLSPATAKNAVVMGSSSEARHAGTCGDSSSVNDVSAFGSRQVLNEPGRVKPDFVAPGTRIVSTFTLYRGEGFYYGGLCQPDASGLVSGTSERYGYGSGTSFSAPQAAGQAVLLSKRFKNIYSTDPTPAMIKAMMAIGAERMIGGRDNLTGQLLTGSPRAQGWGRLNLSRLVDGTPSIAGDEDHGFPPYRRFTATGQFYTFTFTVADASKPVRIALAFTDRYAAVNAVPSSVNQLSMYVMQGGFNYCDGTSYDSLGHTPRTATCGPPDGDNNLHFISIAPNSFTGQFQLQIRADNIAMMAVPGADPDGVANQDFAAWVYNAY